MENDLQGRTVLISGGSSGIGKKIAGFLLQNGCKVIIVSVDRKQLADTQHDLPSAHVFYCDIANHESVHQLITQLHEKRLVPQALINAAAILGPVGKFGDNDFPLWSKTVEIDLIGNARLLHALLPTLLEQERPKVINFGGGGAAYSRPYHTAYASAKTGMVRLTEIISDEYKGKLDINIIAPGAHKTAMWNDETHDAEPKEWADDNKLFALIEYLLSRRSDGISGRFIHIENDYASFTPQITGSDSYVLRRTK